MVVILAAGKGSRMNLKGNVSKCSVTLPDGSGDSSVARLVRQFKSLGETKFVIVVGYGAESVVKSVEVNGESIPEVDITWIYNGKYETRGCEYSLACAASSIEEEDDHLIIVEGDLVTTRNNLATIVETPSTSVLVRDKNLLCKKSVAVLCDDEGVRAIKFLYDKSHELDMSLLRHLTDNVYDSFQVWRINKDDLMEFKSRLSSYKRYADDISSGKDFKMASGLLTINSLILDRPMNALHVPDPNSWINLNSESDIDLLNNDKETPWFQRTSEDMW